MTTSYWLKLWIDLLDDPKTGRIPDWLFRRFILFLCAAKEYDHDGLLQPVPDLAWRLRLSEAQVDEALRALSEAGVVQKTADGWLIVNFRKRQAPSDSADRVRRFREEKKQCNVTVTDTSSALLCSDSVNNKESLNTPIFQIYEREIGMLTPMIACELAEAEKEYPPNWLEPAFQEAVRANARNWRYVQAILKRWKVDGFQSRKNKDGQIVQGPMTLDEEIQLALKRDGLA